MIFLLLALLAFAVVHLIPAIPRAKTAAQARLGRGYGPAYGIASLVLLALAVCAFRNAEPGFVYDPPSWGRHANFALTFIAFLFVGIFLARGSWRNRVKYPMALAVGFWSAGHLLANGDTRSVVFFATLACTSFVHMFLVSRLYDSRPSEVRGGHDLLSVLIGVALFGVFVQAHDVIAGVPVFDLAGLSQ